MTSHRPASTITTFGRNWATLPCHSAGLEPGAGTVAGQRGPVPPECRDGAGRPVGGHGPSGGWRVVPYRPAVLRRASEGFARAGRPRGFGGRGLRGAADRPVLQFGRATQRHAVAGGRPGPARPV